MANSHTGVGVICDELKRKDWEDKSRAIPAFDANAEALNFDEEFVQRAKNVLAHDSKASTTT